MGWHDAVVWAFQVQHGEYPEPEDYPDDVYEPPATDRLALDLDYITQWVEPARRGGSFTFWVAPCTLVFSGVTELKMDIDDLAVGPRQIQDITAVRGGWHIEGQQDMGFEGSGFDIWVKATRFKQTFRQEPRHVEYQQLSLAERGGWSFSESPTETN